jgi:trans-aconitate methyltransferase
MGGKPPGSRFESQASFYDRRAGLPDHAARRIADAVLQAGGAGRGALVEWGAGTGQIGALLRARHERYIAFDSSPAMLSHFRQRDPRAALVVADGASSWPLRPQSCDLIFASRFFHLLPSQHVVEQALQALTPGGVLLIGRVELSRDSVKRRLRRRLRELLEESGLAPERGERKRDVVVALASEHGAEALAASRVCNWRVHERPSDSLSAWASKPGLGGVDLEESLQRKILADVRAWAEESLGPLDSAHASEEAYCLSGFRRPL